MQNIQLYLASQMKNKRDNIFPFKKDEATTIMIPMHAAIHMGDQRGQNYRSKIQYNL